jgi:GNAT superfamily N-acetyltransferase
MKVRLGMDDEADVLVGMASIACAESTPHLTFNAGRVRALYRRYLETACPTFFFVEDRDGVVGFLQATMSEYEFADGFFTTQQVLWVYPDKRGTRAAALLMSAFTSWSDRLGAIENTGGNDNDLTSDRTARFLGRFGFQRVGFFVRRMRGSRGEKGRR